MDCNPLYDIDERLFELGYEFGEPYDDEILLIDCPGCRHVTIYQHNGFVFDRCECCGCSDLAAFESLAYTLLEYWGKEFAGYDGVDNFNLPR